MYVPRTFSVYQTDPIYQILATKEHKPKTQQTRNDLTDSFSHLEEIRVLLFHESHPASHFLWFIGMWETDSRIPILEVDIWRSTEKQ
jgi:hypothetical protein